MNWFADHALHLVLIGGYLVILGHHAAVGRRNVRSVEDYLVAGRRLGGIVIALSFYATFMSTNTFIGAAGKSWEFGLVWCLGGVVLTGLACVSWLFVAPRFVPLTRQYRSLTVADFLGTHYSSRTVRRVAAVIVAFASVLYLVAIYRGAALALQSFLSLSYVWCVIAILVVVTSYTLMGGFESVALTDALQGVIMLAGAVVMPVAIIAAAGGPDQVLRTLRLQDPSLTSFTSGPAISAVAAYSLAVGVKFLVEPRQLSRFYGLKDQGALKRASLAAPLAIMVTYLCLLPVGALARAIIPEDAISNTDQAVPHLLGPANLLGPYVGSVFLLVLVSAAMSSIDSVLLVAAATIDRDLIGCVPVQEAQEGERAADGVRRARIWVVLVSAAAAGTALLPFTRDIVAVTKFSGSLYGTCFLPVLVLGLFLRRRSAAAAVATMIAGTLCVVAAFACRELGVTSVEEVYPGMLLGMAVFVALSAVLARSPRNC